MLVDFEFLNITMIKKLKRQLKKFWLILANKYVEIAILAIFITEFGFPHMTLANTIEAASGEANMASPAVVMTAVDAPFPAPEMPEAEAVEVRVPKRVIWVTVTAYSSTPDQTDSDPCTTANGFNVCENNEENVIAANFLKFGTEVKMPDYFGDRVFKVQDRMNARYNQRVDVWFKTREAAKQFGVRRLKVEIY